MINIKEVEAKIDNIVVELNALKSSLNESEIPEEPSDFEALKAVLQTERWPVAVNPTLICDPNNDEEKTERGRGVISFMIDEDLKDRKFLDMGCSEGQMVFAAAEHNPIIAVGYDTKANEKWKEHANVLLTNNFDEVKLNGPYDAILMFEVLDHIENETPVDFLKKAHSVLADNGKIYLRCHPFTSRHATHLYRDLNKAWIHLVFTPEELAQIVPNAKTEPNIGVSRPIARYKQFFEEAGFKIENKKEITDIVEPFFKTPKIAERIMKTVGFGSFPDYQMSLSFVDYVLTKNLSA